MQRRLIVGLAGLIVAGCGEPSEEERQQEAERAVIIDAEIAVREMLRDPDSAQFENVYVSRRSGAPVVCGTVNARNGFGGYAGPSPFYAAQGVAVLATAENASVFADGWSEFCAVG